MADLSAAIEIPNWAIVLGTNLFTAFASFIVALSNRGPAMQVALDTKLKVLIDGYDKRVSELTAEVHGLRAEIGSLRSSLDATTRELHEVKMRHIVE